MNKKQIITLTMASLTLLLAGCGANNSTANHHSKLLASQTSTKIKTKHHHQLSPQQTVSLVTTYAGNKYGSEWAQTAKDAHNSQLQVKLYPTSNYHLSDNGLGVAYNVCASGNSTQLVYTVKGDQVTIYSHAGSNNQAKKLGTVTRQQMVDYVNQKGQASFANGLAKNAQIVDKRTNGSGTSANSATSTSSSSNQASGKYGNEGAVNVPSDMEGTWYTADNGDESSVTFSGNTMQFNDHHSAIYKQSNSFLSDDSQTNDEQVQNATQNWQSGSFNDVHGLHFLTLRGWTQTAGDGESFAVHTETINGKPVKVLVAAGGAGFSTDAVYYQSKALAHSQSHTKYDDLHYSDDN